MQYDTAAGHDTCASTKNDVVVEGSRPTRRGAPGGMAHVEVNRECLVAIAANHYGSADLLRPRNQGTVAGIVWVCGSGTTRGKALYLLAKTNVGFVFCFLFAQLLSPIPVSNI